ncbi:MAG: ATP synthase F1 subunit epsilon [Myxococcota bacterium]
MPLELSIVTPEAEAVKVTCDEVTAPGKNGEIGLLPGHVPLITVLRPGLLTVITGGKKTVYAVSTGYAEVQGESVTVLTEDCELGDNVDVDRARNDIREAEKALETLGEADADYGVHRTRLERAQARLDAASTK